MHRLWKSLLVCFLLPVVVAECGKHGGGDGDHPEHEPDTPDEEKEASKVRNVVLLLIVSIVCVTILFEFIKEKIEELAEGPLEPIVEKLWAELTILGFVGVLAFLLAKTKALLPISCTYFGEEETVTELLENTHELLFVIMCLFISQTLVLVLFAKKISRRWGALEEEATGDPEGVDARFQQTGASEAAQQDSMLNLFAGTKPPKDGKANNTWAVAVMEYKAMRAHFLCPSYASDVELPKTFNFSKYLSVILGEQISRLVDVTNLTWVLLEGISIVFYFIFAGNRVVRIVAFISSGFLMIGVFIAVNRNLTHIRSQLLPPLRVKKKALPRPPMPGSPAALGGRPPLLTHKQSSFSMSANPDGPAFLSLQPQPRRGWLEKLVYSRPPLRHEMLFWLDNHGPKAFFFIIQNVLLLNAIYVALLGYYFGKVIVDFDIHVALKALLFVAAALPPAFILLQLTPHILRLVIEVCHIEELRDNDVEKAVAREAKTKKTMRALRMIASMQRQSSVLVNSNQEDLVKKLTAVQRDELTDLFNVFDKDGGGTISQDEVKILLESLGTKITDAELTELILRVDESGDAELDIQEFLQFMAGLLHAPCTLEETVELIFAAMDEDHSGTVSVQEFSQVVSKLDNTFTQHEVEELVKEIDVDGDGEINAEEFTALLRRHLD